MNNDISKSLIDLAARIRVSHEAVRHALRSAVERAMATGDLLLEAKEQVQHGQWSQWIQEHCEISDRTARLYMQLAENRVVIETTGNVAGLTLNSAVRLLAPPEEDNGLEEAAAKINILYAKAKINVANMKKDLAEIRATFDNEEEFNALLQQEFPEPTDPKEKEAADQIGELILIMAGIIPMDDN
jgi:hypothetical protein